MMPVLVATGAVGIPLAPSYDPLFVFLSYLIAVGASYAALDLTERVTTTRGSLRWNWLLAGAFTMGAGIWSMHFTGMLAFRYPVITTGTYDLALTILSLVIAILASGFALFIASRRQLGLPNLLMGGTVMGGGIASMHYTGMQAMRGPCVIAYSPGPFVASLVIAVAASIGALWLAFSMKNEGLENWSWSKVGSALVMGGAIVGMHYIGMASGTYTPTCGPNVSVNGMVSVSNLGGSAIAFGTLLITAVAVLNSYGERLRWQQDLLKDRFLGILSHELRTPLNAIVGYGSILEDGVLGPMTPGQSQAVNRMLEGADSLLRLVDDLLDSSRIQAGRLSLNPRSTDFSAVAKEAITALAPLAAHKHLALINNVPGGLPPLYADAQRLNQVLVNLLFNAIKFTPDGGTITVRARLDGDRLRCEVCDTGIGIAAKDLGKLFQPFTQLDMSETRKAGGTGLGLSIAKALIDAHGGEIGVDSELGIGSTFWFTLKFVGNKA